MSMPVNRCISVLVTFLSLVLALPCAGSDRSGTCHDFDFPVDAQGMVDWPYTVRVVRHATPVYPSATAVTAPDGMTLPFNRSLNVLKAEGARLQVRRLNALDPLGWVDRSALLCNLTPLTGDSGLEKKLYIKTATEVRREKPTTVKAYPTPDLSECFGMCRELSRFAGYFVAAETETAYLLSLSYRLVEEPLVGWVDKANGFIWDTAYGLRPREDLVFPEYHELAGQERTVCAYLTLEDARAGERCQPILGGRRWFRYGYRIPILERLDQGQKAFYKVVLPIAGTSGEPTADGRKIRISPEQLTDNPGIESLLSMNRVDVLFLIDGTASMEPYIQAIRGSAAAGRPGVIQQIVRAFEADDTFAGAQLRFGFRIYRDAYAGSRELGEGLPVPVECEWTRALQEANLTAFQENLARVQVTQDDGDDYEENLFGGIQRAVRDLRGCPQNTKILFVIGDHGYDPEAQKRRGRRAVGLTELTARLMGSRETETKNIVTFFLQTPNNRVSSKAPDRYQRAYDLFGRQARAVLGRILQTGRSSRFEVDNYFLRTDDHQLNAKIIAGIKQFSNPQVINELVLDLRGGTPLIDAITRLQGSQEYNNIPGLFWDLVEQASWKMLGVQARRRVYDTILEAYIPVSRDIVEDVWLKSEDLNQWELLLRNVGDLSHISGSELRETFGIALKDALEKVIRKPRYADTGEPLEVYLERKGGLPVRDTSPLFRYSLDELRNRAIVPDCEIIRLMTWLNNARQMLSVIYHGNFRPVFTTESFPGECPSGNDIPFISGDIRHAPLGDDPNMRYDHSFQKAHIFWVPKEYLP